MQIIKKLIIAILLWESKVIIKKYKPFIIAVTGSVGKTSTKDAIFAVVKNHAKFARKSEKSLNSDIGLPLTIIGVPSAWRSPGGWISNIMAGLRLILSRKEYPDCLVLEIGADHPNDIRSVARWLQPHIAVITKVSRTPVHVEFFSSPEEVFEEKASLAESVRPGGSLVLFADDEKVMSIAERVKEKNVSVISFGTSEQADVRGSDAEVAYSVGAVGKFPVGMKFALFLNGNASHVTVKNILGPTYMYPLLAAAAVGKAQGISPDQIIKKLGEYNAPRGRMNIIPGMNGSIIIDDSYNSSPDAATAALDTLKNLECDGSRIAVLGDMMELGQFSTDEHRRIGTYAATRTQRLVTVGVRSRSTAEEAIKAGLSAEMVKSFATAEEAGIFLQTLVKGGDCILVKGSQSVRTEKIVKMLMNEPDRAPELLVRQEKEWLERP